MMQWELLWYSAQSRLGPKWSLEDLQKNKNKGNGDRVRYTLWEKVHALVSVLGNADGVDGTIHARVAVDA